jgi:transposase InsO family protein
VSSSLPNLLIYSGLFPPELNQYHADTEETHFLSSLSWTGQSKVAPSGHEVESNKQLISEVEPQSSEVRLVYRLGHSHRAIVIEGQIAGKRVKALIDSGATANFVSSSWVYSHSVETREVSSEGPRVEVADGRVRSCTEKIQVELNLGGYCSEVTAYLFPLKSFDLVLGMAWLQAEQPSINWRTREVVFTTRQGDVVTVKSQQDRPMKQVGLLSEMTVTELSTSSNEELPEKVLKELSDMTVQDLFHEHQDEFICSLLEDIGDVPKVDVVVAAEAVKLLEEYQDVMPEELPKVLPPRRGVEHVIEVVPGQVPPAANYHRIPKSWDDELQKQLQELKQLGLIRESTSPYGAPVLFVKKPGSEKLRMCMDYRALNAITIKNKAPLPRIDDLLDRLHGAKWFSKIDLKSGYWQVRISEEDVPKTAFTTRYGSFEWLVLPFGLCNAPSTFQALMNSIFFSQGLDAFLIVYLDDILIYSQTLGDHEMHVRLVLDLLRQHQLYANAEKCLFFQKELPFVGHVVSRSGVSMDPSKIAAIMDWPELKSVKDVERFLGLTGYYRRFIKNYAQLTLPLVALKQKDSVFHWGEGQQQAFAALKQAVTQAPVLTLPAHDKPFVIVTDASGRAIGAALMQDQGKGLQPIAFLSRKLNDAETRYPTHEQELLALVYALKKWDYYLLGTVGNKAYTDHHPLRYFSTQPKLSMRQARWLGLFQEYDVYVDYIPGKHNVVADALSRRSDYLVSMVLDNQELLERIKSGYGLCEESKKIIARLDRRSKEYCRREGLIYYKDRIYVPQVEAVRLELLEEFHDSSIGGHLGQDKTYSVISRAYYWPGLQDSVKNYVATCHQCATAKTNTQPPAGLLSSLPIPGQPFEWVTMDFVTGLPVTDKGHDAIAVFVDRLTKYVIAVPTVTQLSAAMLAELYFEHIVCSWGLPKVIVSDRGPQFRSKFWKALQGHLKTRVNMSTAFHPQTDGQTERANRTIEDLLRAYCSQDQKQWDNFLKPICFAYNQATQVSTGHSPFYLTHGYHPLCPATLHLGAATNAAAHSMATRVQTAIKLTREHLKKAQEKQKLYADRKRRDLEFEEGDRVYLDTSDLSLKEGQVRKLTEKRIGPYLIKKKLSPVNYVLDLPKEYSRIHATFHISKLTKAQEGMRAPVDDEGEARPTIVEVGPLDGTDLWVVEDIVDREWRWHSYANGTGRWNAYYLVKWEGFPELENSWEPLWQLRRKVVAQKRMELDKRFNKENKKMKPSGKPPTVANE